MNLFNFLGKRGSAPVARERLQIVLAHERALNGSSGDLVRLLQEEILAVVAKHIKIEREMVQIKLDRGDSISTLEIDIHMPAEPAVAG
ncbi:Cell division topological specificity factor [Rhodovastum atsumiense]|uniref:Cell division topological specificity factor n=1 Tax=Rhodovastum atsumiense TaxID=504468 RepID=A0A5M6IL01_9PROT|nr:cell division topological specificity factor MinE [Rhodovastum atsumiense]KAA5608930.1 cell division topological specificity factor MinE [Rhodovastum atsumiense]CAH2604216.1 Cell division topological specificity factor [Rhodovastum atsumiense]